MTTLQALLPCLMHQVNSQPCMRALHNILESLVEHAVGGSVQQLAVDNQALEHQAKAGDCSQQLFMSVQHRKVSVLISAMCHAVGLARSS